VANDCTKHAGQHNQANRANLDDMMRDLQENQAGAGRHKCPYCAYEQGFEHGLRRAAEIIRDFILKESGAPMNPGNI